MKPYELPRHSPEHLVWRLEYIDPDAPPAWFYFSGRQIDTMVRSMRAPAPTKDQQGDNQ